MSRGDWLNTSMEGQHFPLSNNGQQHIALFYKCYFNFYLFLIHNETIFLVSGFGGCFKYGEIPCNPLLVSSCSDKLPQLKRLA